MITFIGQGPLARLCCSQLVSTGRYNVSCELSDASTKSSVLLSVQHPTKLPDHILSRFRLSLNLHTGLLPGNAGVHTCSMPIIRCDATGGVTLHEMTSLLDGGAVVLREEYELSDYDTCETLFYKNIAAGLRLFTNLLELLECDMDGGVTEKSLQTIHAMKTAQVGLRRFTKYQDMDFNTPIEYEDTPVFYRNIRARFFPLKQLPVFRHNGIVYHVTSIVPFLYEPYDS